MAKSARPKDGARNRSLGEVVVCVSRELASAPAGLTKKQLAAIIGQTSEPTVHRALNALRNTWGGKLSRKGNRWRLDEPLPLPLLDPEDNDVLAVLLAAAMVQHVADDDTQARLVALGKQLEAKRHERHAGGRFTVTAITASLTLGSRVDEATLTTFLRSVRSRVVRMRYTSPWTNTTVEHTVEPWGLRIHDGTVYLRAWCRGTNGPRTFRLPNVEPDVEVLERGGPRTPLPPLNQVWAAGDPAYGIDDDRPGTAVLRIRGGVARWLSPIVWSPAQRDDWLEEGELLERSVPYQSCREMARRVLSIIDAVESIEPRELHEEVERSIGHWRENRRRVRRRRPPKPR